MGDGTATLAVQCVDDLFVVDLGSKEHGDTIRDSDAGGELPPRARPVDLVPDWVGSHLVDVDARDATIVLLVSRRPPLMVSYDIGRTWNERGGGLAPGRAVAIDENPDRIVVASRNRLFVSSNGGVFWRSVSVELPEIVDVAWGTLG